MPELKCRLRVPWTLQVPEKIVIVYGEEVERGTCVVAVVALVTLVARAEAPPQVLQHRLLVGGGGGGGHTL